MVMMLSLIMIGEDGDDESSVCREKKVIEVVTIPIAMGENVTRVVITDASRRRRGRR